MRSALIAVVVALIAGAVDAGPRWIEVTGLAVQSGPEDAPAARRRAVADALLQAALAGGAEVRGHSAVSMGVVTSDTAIVRAVGRVLEFRLIDDQLVGDRRQVRIAAQVEPAGSGGCAARPVLLTVLQPEINVSPSAPAWAEPLARQIAARLRDRVARLPGATTERVVAATVAVTGAAPLGRSGTAVRIEPGAHGLLARINLATDAAGASGKALTLQLMLTLVAGDGSLTREEMRASVPLPGGSALGRVAVLAQPGRDRLAADLTAGVEPALDRLVQAVRCSPISARMAVSGGQIRVGIGRRHGLSQGAVAFTADRDASTELLEITALEADAAILRPLDPQRPAKAFAGRAVQFLDTAP